MEDQEKSKDQLIEELARMRQRLGELEASEAAQERGKKEQAAAGDYLRLLLESTDEGIYGLDSEGHCILINRSAAKMFGYLPEDLLGKELHPLMHHTRVDGSPYPQDECPIFQAFRVGQGTRVDNEVFWRKDGTSFPVEYSSYPIIEDGNIRGAVVTFIDISERKRMVLALQKARGDLELQVEKRTSELRKAVGDLRNEIVERELAENALRTSNEDLGIYARVFDHSPDFISVLDRQYTYKMINHTYIEMFQRQADEIIGHTVADLFGEDLFRNFLRPRLDRCFAGEPTGYESWLNLPVGPRFLETHYYPLPLDGEVEYVVVVGRDATERKQVEEERERLIQQLETQRGRLEEILRQMPAGVVIAEAPSGKLVLGNEQMERIFRQPFLPSDSIKEYREWKAFHPDGKPLEPEEYPLARSIRSGEVVTGEEIGIMRGDGTLGVVLANSAPIRDRNGHIVAAVSTFIDITGRKQTEEALRQSEERFRRLAQASFEAIVIHEGGRILEVNDAFVRMLGYERSELIGKSALDLVITPESGQTVAEHIRLGSEEPYEAMALRKDGTTFPVEVNAKPILYQGRVARVAAIHDITDRKRIEELVEVAQRRANELETIIASIADAVFVWDNQRRIADLNAVALRFLGLAKKEEAINLSADYLKRLDLRHLDGRPVAPEERGLERALRGEVVRDFEQIALDVHSGHDMYLLTSAAPLRDSTGNIVGAVVVNSDITHIKELDRLKDQFISIAAHELKTPVAIMKGYSQALLKAKERIPSSYVRVLEAIDRGSDRIDNVVGDLLDVSQLQLGRLDLEMERIDLPVLVQQVIAQMALTVSKHNLRLVQTEPVVVQGDRDRLEQVLVNLLDNAVTYSPRGGDIDVSIFVRDHEAIVSVRDYGIGIPRGKQEHIFERFYRAHTGTPYDYGGMGVGLYISKEIINRHGGRMWFESEEGKGSTFYFSLPLKGENEEIYRSEFILN